MIINSQLGGKKPTGTKSITSNGVYDVTDFASADVNVPTTAPEIYRAFRADNGALKNSITTPFTPLPASVKQINDVFGAFYRWYMDTPANILSGQVDLSNIVSINASNCFYQAFFGCTGITGCLLSSLESLTNADICSSMFYNCSGLETVDLSSLTIISGARACNYMFGSTKLKQVKFDSLRNVTNATALQTAFANCTFLTDIYYPALKTNSFSGATNALFNLVMGTTGCSIHFPKNLDPQTGSTTISSLGTYPNFGGTNTVLLYDLPSTFVLTGANGTAYERNPKYDTTNALSWRVNNSSVTTTQYYTNGTSDPQVGDTIYSDAACTIAVTTISSIA